jgi:hypothetical protein
MTLRIEYVPADYAAQTWPLVADYLNLAVPHGRDDYTLEQIKLLVCTGQWLLLVAVDEDNQIHGAATVLLSNYPNHRVAFIMYIGGKLITNKETYQQLVEAMKQRGVTKIQAAVRPEMERLCGRYGFKKITSIVEVKL